MTMPDSTVAAAIKLIKRRHPDVLPALRVLTASQGEVAAAATTVLTALLHEADEGEQARWTMRSLLKRVPKLDGGFYWALSHSATLMVHRLILAGEADTAGCTFYAPDPPPEIANWKDDSCAQ